MVLWSSLTSVSHSYRVYRIIHWTVPSESVALTKNFLIKFRYMNGEINKSVMILFPQWDSMPKRPSTLLQLSHQWVYPGYVCWIICRPIMKTDLSQWKMNNRFIKVRTCIRFDKWFLSASCFAHVTLLHFFSPARCVKTFVEVSINVE